MSYPSIDEMDLLGFFGVEPMSSDENIPWAYLDSEYCIDSAGTSVSFTIHPACKDVHIILKRDGVTFYEFKAQQIEDILYHNDSGRETIELVISESDNLWFRLYPHVSISHHKIRRP